MLINHACQRYDFNWKGLKTIPACLPGQKCQSRRLLPESCSHHQHHHLKKNIKESKGKRKEKTKKGLKRKPYMLILTNSQSHDLQVIPDQFNHLALLQGGCPTADDSSALLGEVEEPLLQGFLQCEVQALSIYDQGKVLLFLQRVT